MIQRQYIIGWYLVFASMTAFPHSLQPDAVLRFSQIHVAPDAVSLIYIVEPGPEPYDQMENDIDQNEDGEFSEEEFNAYLNRIKTEYLTGQKFQLDETSIPMTLYRSEIYEAVGHHSADTIRIELGYLGEIPSSIPRGATVALHYEDNRLKGVPGWKQIKFFSEDGVQFSGHIPYEDYAMFDLTLEQELQFTPSTSEINLEVLLPEETSRNSRELLGAKLDNSPMFQSGLVRIKKEPTTIYWILGGMMLIFGLGLAAKQFGWVR